jgi:hypothetical protein
MNKSEIKMSSSQEELFEDLELLYEDPELLYEDPELLYGDPELDNEDETDLFDSSDDESYFPWYGEKIWFLDFISIKKNQRFLIPLYLLIFLVIAQNGWNAWTNTFVPSKLLLITIIAIAILGIIFFLLKILEWKTEVFRRISHHVEMGIFFCGACIILSDFFITTIVLLFREIPLGCCVFFAISLSIALLTKVYSQFKHNFESSRLQLFMVFAMISEISILTFTISIFFSSAVLIICMYQSRKLLNEHYMSLPLMIVAIFLVNIYYLTNNSLIIVFLLLGSGYGFYTLRWNPPEWYDPYGTRNILFYATGFIFIYRLYLYYTGKAISFRGKLYFLSNKGRYFNWDGNWFGRISSFQEFKGLHRARRIQVINISNNNISELPDYIRNFPNLRQLWLNNNKFKEVPSVVSHIKGLTYLSLSYNPISSLSNLDLSKTSIKSLRLIQVGLNRLDLQCPKTPTLKSLSLHMNNLNSIEGLYQYFPNLIQLGVSNNNLSSFPSEVENLKYLEKINLIKNQIKKLPQIENPSLKWVNLQDNPLIYIHENNFKNQKRYLSLRRCPISHIFFDDSRRINLRWGLRSISDWEPDNTVTRIKCNKGLRAIDIFHPQIPIYYEYILEKCSDYQNKTYWQFVKALDKVMGVPLNAEGDGLSIKL